MASIVDLAMSNYRFTNILSYPEVPIDSVVETFRTFVTHTDCHKCWARVYIHETVGTIVLARGMISVPERGFEFIRGIHFPDAVSNRGVHSTETRTIVSLLSEVYGHSAHQATDEVLQATFITFDALHPISP